MTICNNLPARVRLRRSAPIFWFVFWCVGFFMLWNISKRQIFDLFYTLWLFISNEAVQYDTSRFSAYRDLYVLNLDVKKTITTDAGLYVCAQPAVHHTVGHLGLIAVVGVVCELLSFLPRDAAHSADCCRKMSVCPSHAGIVLKRLNI